MGTTESIGSEPSMRSVGYWETLFAEEDPWKYSTSEYERWKTGLVLEQLPTGRPRFAMEVGCAEGHMSMQLAQRVDRLLAVDISSKAIKRARARCAGSKHVEFRQLDIVDGDLPKQLDLILVSEVLFYISREELGKVAARFAEQLKIGGHVLLVHGNVIQDDRTRTGFDWGHEFGALTIGSLPPPKGSP
jgi:SAM-dependent methyltransferase